MEETPWIKLTPEDSAVVEEIDRERDRGAALIAGALVEQRLAQTIKIRLRPDRDIEKRLFRGMGGLGSFAAKIHLGYLMQLYPIEVHSLLDQLRDVRNDFAHETQPITFTTPAVAEKCLAMTALLAPAFIEGTSFVHEIGFHARSRKTPLIATPGGHFGFTVSIKPRESYITTAKLCLFLLALATEAYANDRIPTPQPRALPEKPAPPPTRAARAPNPHRKMRKLQRKSSREKSPPR